MKRLKDRLGLEIRSFPPHLHWWNKAEGVIKIIREAAVKRLQRLKPHATKHGLVIDTLLVYICVTVIIFIFKFIEIYFFMICRCLALGIQ